MQLRATIGDVMCQFYIAEEKDPAMMVSFSKPLSLSSLQPLHLPSFNKNITCIPCSFFTFLLSSPAAEYQSKDLVHSSKASAGV